MNRPNIKCPRCDSRLIGSGARNAWQCQRCGRLVVEAIDTTRERVRELYRRATGKTRPAVAPTKHKNSDSGVGDR